MTKSNATRGSRNNRNYAFAFGALGASFGVLACGGTASSEVDTASLNSALTGTHALATNTKFFVPPPDPGAVKQAEQLLRSRKLLDAVDIAAVEATPSAVWFTSGTPADVQRAAQKTAAEAKAEKRVPVMVAYNVPFRDCAQYSAGGALDTAAYEQWIDGFAAGIGDAPAVVILEPDGLGLIPYNTTIFGGAEHCQPTVTDASGNVSPAP